MNMIVCTCDVCGKETKTYDQMNLNFQGNMWQKQVCPDCKIKTMNFIEDFITNFSGTNPNGSNKI